MEQRDVTASTSDSSEEKKKVSISQSREKTFAKFDVLWLFTKVSLQNLGAWHPLVAPVSNARKLPAIRYVAKSVNISSV